MTGIDIGQAGAAALLTADRQLLDVASRSATASAAPFPQPTPASNDIDPPAPAGQPEELHHV